MSFSSFPVELHHQILCFMDPEDILTLRKTSKYFCALTHEPRLWTALHYCMHQTHPLGCSRSEFAALTHWQSERLLVRASKTQKVFQTFRDHAQHRIFPSGQTRQIGPVVALSFLSERFLLSVDNTTVVYVWDVSSSAQAHAFPCARLTLVGWNFLAYGMSGDDSTLYIVLSKGARAHVFSLSLPSTSPDADQPRLSFRDVAYFDTHFNTVRSIDPDSCLVLLQISHNTIQVVDWRTENLLSILLHQDTTETPNYVLALRICGPYILCFRRRSVEAYPIPLQFSEDERASEEPLPVLQYTMLGMAFSAHVALSRVRCTRFSSGDGDSDDVTYALCALAQDGRRGTFHFQVRVRVAPVPVLSLRLLALDPVHAHVHRRVLSAWDLGTSGLRGACAFRPNAGAERHIVAFTVPACPSQAAFEGSGGNEDLLVAATVDDGRGGTLDVPPEIAPRFEESIVSVVSSWDSDDDVIKCAVSEFTGKIALGSRKGAITVI